MEEIDGLLHSVASKIKWSSPAVRASQSAMSSRSTDDMQDIYRRLSAREAKWFTRLVLKNYQPLILESQLVYRCCDSTLPLILQIQDDFTAAIKSAQAAKGHLLPQLTIKGAKGQQILSHVKPQMGIKVGRQNWFKARSIKHCLDMGHGRMCVESKMDGEYCQIHITLSTGGPNVQIFSKSGKDSTEDRRKLHSYVKFRLVSVAY